MVPRVVSVALLFLAWELVSRAVSASVVPSFARVTRVFVESLGDGYVWSDMAITFGRVFASFALSMLLALAIGMAIGTVRWFGRMFDFWVTVAAAVPSILYVVVAYLWFGLNEVAAVLAAALVVTPSAAFNVIQGVQAIDPGLSEMARAFRVPRRAIVRRRCA